MKIGRLRNYFGDNKIYKCTYQNNPDEQTVQVKNDMSLLFQGEKAYEIGYAGESRLVTGDIIEVDKFGNVIRIYSSENHDVTLFVTNECNNNCIMCPMSVVSRRLSGPSMKAKLLKVIEMMPQDLYHCTITGGEPTLDSDTFLSVLRNLKTKYMNTEFQILTNGRTFSSATFLEQVFEVIPSKVLFGIPIHGANSKTHDNITLSRGSFKQTDVGIKNLISMMQKVEIRVVVSKLNLEEMDAIADYIIANYSGAFSVTFIAMEMMGAASVNYDSLWEDYDVIYIGIKNAINKLIKNGFDVQLYNFPLCSIDREHRNLSKRSITDYKVRYMEDCDNCVAKNNCCGFFVSTKNRVKPKVHPLGEVNSEIKLF